MELSKRLTAVAGLVTEGASVADIGTDHGYVPIYLAETKRCPHIIAMDIHKGPLEKARQHIREHSLEEKIETRLSDGLAALEAREADTVIAAGMGGRLVIQILKNDPEKTAGIREFILQPQSDIPMVRAYLNENGFCLAGEDMVEEDGKYYPVMKLKHGREAAYSEEELLFGRLLLKNRHPVLRQFLQKEKERIETVQSGLRLHPGERVLTRYQELEKELACISRGMAVYQEAEDV